MPMGDKIEWHTKIGNMVSRDLIQATTNAKKLKGMVSKLESQMKHKKIVNKEILVSIHDL